MVDSINVSNTAYLNSIYASHHTISAEYTTTFGGQLAGGGTVEDVVTLSPAAQEVLKYQAQTEKLDSTGNPIITDEASTGNIVAADLEGRDLSGTDLTGATLNYANLKNANLNNAVLRGATFGNADVTGATFHGADLRGANFGGVTGLTYGQLAGARTDINTVLPIAVVRVPENLNTAGLHALQWATFSYVAD